MWKLSTQNIFLCPHPKLPALKIESLKHLTRRCWGQNAFCTRILTRYRKIEKGVPHLHPRWHADSGQVRGAAGSSHWSAPSWWAPLLLVVQHHGATSGAAGTWGTTVPLLLTRPAAASSSQPLGPALLIIHRSPSCPPPAGPSWPGPALPESSADENVSASAASFMSTGLDCLALSFKVLSWKSNRNAFQTKLEVEYIWKRE